ncbi:MAG: ergothioneine biosynthesis protein EgtB [Flavobacteriia bacterium]|nr:ergothioneine biosynthesis protein EgtB [Flavobacteriia bacterium]
MSNLERYLAIRELSEKICEPLATEDFGMQPFAFGSPPKWHLAHTSWFFETFILKENYPEYKIFDKRFPFFFNSYYQTMGERQQRDRRGWLTRPYVDEIMAYRAHVDYHMRELISNSPAENIRSLIEIGLHHEQQHQELLLTDIKLGLSVQPFDPIYSRTPHIPDGKAVVNESREWIEIHAGMYSIGHDGEGFAFDNEFARHEVYLNRFKIASTPVTTGEYIEFIEAGGYKNFNYWHDEGWAWIQDEEIQLPLYWKKEDSGYTQFTLSGRKPILGNEVMQHLSYYEASAYAAWKGLRLPTEFEWEVASDNFSWGSVWEWTNSAYLAYPGYKKPPGAVGEYNGKFMVNQMVLRGSSIATSPNHARKTYRNFFHAPMRWQFSGLRLASDT